MDAVELQTGFNEIFLATELATQKVPGGCGSTKATNRINFRDGEWEYFGDLRTDSLFQDFWMINNISSS